MINIIKNNSLNEIEYVLNQVWPDLTKLVFTNEFEGKDELIKEVSNEIIGLVDKSLKKPSEDTTFKVINILKLIDDLVHTQTYKDVINQKVASMLGSENIIDNIQYNIDKLIGENKETDVIKILNFISNIKEKDVFINKYYQLLVKRLMSKISEIKPNQIPDSKTVITKYFHTEKKILEVLKQKFGDKLVYKLYKVISDTEVSFDDNVEFNKLKIDNFENQMVVITTSYNNWDINQNEGIVNSSMVEAIQNTTLGKHLYNYQKYYDMRYTQKRIINWFPHFGEVSVTYLNQELKMLPIQFMVLELFNDVNRLGLNVVTQSKFFSNYTTKFVNDIIGSLVSSRLFKVHNDVLLLSTSGEFKNNLIEIFFTNSDYASVWEQKRQDELAHERVEIVNTNINHQLKLKSMSKEELYQTVAQAVNVFELDIPTFDKSIDYMCRMDYIKIDNSLFHKIVY